MNILPRLSRFFCSSKPSLSPYLPVYRRTFTPSSLFSLKLYTPALIILGYNIYTHEWQTKNLAFLFILSSMALFGSLGTRIRNNSTITHILLNRTTNKLHIKLHHPREEVKKIGETVVDSEFDEERGEIVVPRGKLYVSQTQYSKGRWSEVGGGEFVFVVNFYRRVGFDGKLMPTRYLLHIDLDKNQVEDKEGVLREVFENKEEKGKGGKKEDGDEDGDNPKDDGKDEKK